MTFVNPAEAYLGSCLFCHHVIMPYQNKYTLIQEYISTTVWVREINKYWHLL